MNLMLKFITIFIFFISCKERKQNEEGKHSENIIKQEVELQQEANLETKDSIQVFHISYDSIKSNKTEKITAINKGLYSDFKGYQFDKDPNELRDLKKIREWSKSKGFLKTLTKDFKNNDFLEISSIYYSYVEPRNEESPSRISIEEWEFKNSQKAKSCFESLKKYEDATIHFKTVNWIWVYQDNTIYLVFALDYQVTGKEMQRIKQEIINAIKPTGEYETVQFYE
ncbi:hypothetical protein ACSTS3_08370 [Aquimarina muelleri]|uniref:hypothetical protein n=1 Tax=Aquimarina muelleri TaxID=279356 RepID=UPI003F68872C